jgi:uncharacterized RDD family membrane protein YckC
VNAGEPLEEVLEHLGNPVALAESYLSAVPLIAGDFWSRATARLIDFGLPVVLLAPVGCLMWLAAPLEWVPVLMFIFAFVGGAAIAIYPMVAEAKYGKTLGKHLRGLRVVTESGLRISTGQAVVRNLPWLLEVWWIDALFALFTDRSQRAFELLSKTRVVRSTREQR